MKRVRWPAESRFEIRACLVHLTQFWTSSFTKTHLGLPWSKRKVQGMLGMSLLSFLIVTLIGAAVAVAYHYVIRYRFLEGYDAVFGKLIVGWFGAWLGSPVFGHWLWKIENVYVVPAILGAIATVQLTVLMGKALAKLASMRPVVTEERKEEIRPGKPAAAA